MCCKSFLQILQVIHRKENNIDTCNMFLSSLCFPNAVCPHFLTNHCAKNSLLMVEGLLIGKYTLVTEQIPLCVLHTVSRLFHLKV